MNKIQNKDCIEYIKTLNNKSIDMIILDPPYYKVINEKWDKKWDSLNDYLNWIENVIKEIERVSKYSCSLWIFGFPYQLNYIIPIVEKYNFTYRQMITINKGIRSIAGRCSNKLKMFPTATEYILFFHKEARPFIRNYLNEKKQNLNKTSKEINKAIGKANNGGGTWSSIAGLKQQNLQYPTKEDWIKLQNILGIFDIKYNDYVYKFNIIPGLTDVWNDINFYDKKYKKKHPTQKPFKLIERLILTSSNENDIILDPFMGSGITALVCKSINRNFYGCELDKTYFKNNFITE